MIESNLRGQVAIVTGAGRGIGRATAVALAALDVRVVLAARTVAELRETANAIGEAGGDCLEAPSDVTLEADCDGLVARALDAYGQVDILINNAGTARFAPFWELTTEEFDLNLDVNLRGAFFCARAAARAMLPRRSGQIIHMASSSGKKPYATQAAYCASKAGLIAMSKVMALELRPYGIRVASICPGVVDTRLSEEIHAGREKAGWIQPEDVARGVIYLLTGAANISTDELIIRRFEADPL